MIYHKNNLRMLSLLQQDKPNNQVRDRLGHYTLCNRIVCQKPLFVCCAISFQCLFNLFIDNLTNQLSISCFWLLIEHWLKNDNVNGTVKKNDKIRIVLKLMKHCLQNVYLKFITSKNIYCLFSFGCWQFLSFIHFRRCNIDEMVHDLPPNTGRHMGIKWRLIFFTTVSTSLSLK